MFGHFTTLCMKGLRKMNTLVLTQRISLTIFYEYLIISGCVILKLPDSSKHIVVYFISTLDFAIFNSVYGFLTLTRK